MFQMPADRVAVGLVGGTGASRQLDVVPRHGLRATLRLKHTLPSPLILDAAKQIALEVAFTNSGGRVWPALGDEVGRFELKLANRWLDDAGNVAVAHDGRTLLPHDVEPNMALTLPLLVTTPSEPGTYSLEIAIVQDGVDDQWHAGEGCEAGPVEVVAPVPAASRPQIQMFALSRPCVLDALSESGAEVIDVRRDEAAGPHFRSYTYCATKSEINDSTSAARAGT
jgi:hypothetical protein